MDIHAYWEAVLKQDAELMRTFFYDTAVINWHNTSESFNLEEFITANCTYPGEWDGAVERIEKKDDLIITVTHVFSRDKEQSFHAISFIRVKDDRIVLVDEYWSDDGPAPAWRLEKRIGHLI